VLENFDDVGRAGRAAADATFDARVVDAEVDVAVEDDEIGEAEDAVAERFGLEQADDATGVVAVCLVGFPAAAGMEDLTVVGDDSRTPTFERGVDKEGEVGAERGGRDETRRVGDGAPRVEDADDRVGQTDEFGGRGEAAVELVELAGAPLDAEAVGDERKSQHAGRVDEAADERVEVLADDLRGREGRRDLGLELRADGDGALCVVEGGAEVDVASLRHGFVFESDVESGGVGDDLPARFSDLRHRAGDADVVDVGVLVLDDVDGELRFAHGGAADQNFHDELHHLDGGGDAHRDSCHLEDSARGIHEAEPGTRPFRNWNLEEA